MERWVEAIGDAVRDVLAEWGSKVIMSLLLTLIGAWRIGYTALMVLMVLDLALGVWRAARARELDVAIARTKSLAKLGLYWSIIIAAYQLEVIAHAGGGLLETGGNYSVNVTVLYLGLTEFLSILRHISTLSGRAVNPFSGLPRLIKELKGEHDASSLADSERKRED